MGHGQCLSGGLAPRLKLRAGYRKCRVGRWLIPTTNSVTVLMMVHYRHGRGGRSLLPYGYGYHRQFFSQIRPLD